MALACDLGLDSLPTCMEAHKWSWFRRYCTAARVAKSLENRTPLPTAFCEEVMKKIQEISAEGEQLNRDHEDHSLCGREQDEQLLLWLNRSAFLIRRSLIFSVGEAVNANEVPGSFICFPNNAGGLMTGLYPGEEVDRFGVGDTTIVDSLVALKVPK